MIDKFPEKVKRQGTVTVIQVIKLVIDPHIINACIKLNKSNIVQVKCTHLLQI